MKSSPKPLAMVSVLFVVSAGGCALIGYDLSGYGPAAGIGGGDAGNEGGGGVVASTSGEVYAGGSGGAGPSTVSSSASSSTASGPTCENGCEDNNACTKDFCQLGACTNTPISLVNDGNVCTTDGCDHSTGLPTHIQEPNCCPHSLCKEGVPLNGICNPPGFKTDCVAEVCSLRPACCDSYWDAVCVQLMPDHCINNGPVTYHITCACAHSYCQEGAPLPPECDPCVYAVSQKFPECSEVAWDQNCIEQTHRRCGIPRGPDCQ